MNSQIKTIIYFCLPIIIVIYFSLSGEISVINTLIILLAIIITMIMTLKSIPKKSVTFSQNSASIFSNIMENLNDPLLLLDSKSNIIMANISAINLFGTKLDNQQISDYLFDSSALSSIQNSINTGISDTIEFRHGSPRSKDYLLRIHVADINQNQGNDKNERTIFLTIYDITKIKEAERMRVDFVANVSHELRTPLTSILGFIETLLGPAKDDIDAHVKFLEIMSDEAKRMARLIEDLLSLSDIERDAHIQPCENISLKKIIENVIETMNIRLKNKHMLTSFSTQFNTGNIIGDRDQLTQVFQNLIDNAIKYGSENSTIFIELKSHHNFENSQKYMKISITNSGAGISEEDIERLTERFYRVDKARSRTLGGTGLGLAIVKHIIQRHNGKLSFQSKIGKSTTATVLLPM
ncbi:MAG: GHKL domain-containing protein [Kordiimonadaceae bacterium]|nr:GHKL domain-containing protein [Kordiimonadaceae bacterium]